MMDAVSSLIVRQMDAAAARQKVLAHNLANYGTPGYATKGAKFESELQAAGRPAGAGAAADGASPATQAAGAEAAAAALPAETAEGLELQMARLADNAGRFSALARLLSSRERAYETAIRGR